MHSTCYEKGCQKRGDSRCGTFDGDQCAMRIDQIEKMAVDAADEALGSLLSDDQEGSMKTCECELWEYVGKESAPICGEFEPTHEDDCDDCCKYCRHGEECHLNG